MKTLSIDVKDDSKVTYVIELLKKLDYVEVHIDNGQSSVADKETALDDLFGLWKDRDISLDQLRKKAWD